MTEATIYQTLKPVADAVVKYYRDDFTKHDKRDLARATYGDLFLWAARSHGTNLIRVKDRADSPTEAVKQRTSARLWYEAAALIHGPVQWYLIKPLSNGRGTVRKIGATEIARLLSDA